MVSASPLGSESFASTSTSTAVSLVVVATSSPAFGARLTGVPPMSGAVTSNSRPSFSLGSGPLSMARSTM